MNPILLEYFESIKNKDNFINVLMDMDDVLDNTSNTIHITDYEVTTKISHHYLNHDIPISRNSNTISIKTCYAYHVYYLTVNILVGTNIYQYYSHGEFLIDIKKMQKLAEELTIFIKDVCEQDNIENPIIYLKQTIKDLITNNKLEKIEDIYDEKALFLNTSEDSNEFIPDINDNVVKTL